MLLLQVFVLISSFLNFSHVLNCRSFAKRCKIIEQPNLTQSESVASTELVKDHLFPDPIGIIGDDFMRDLISFELYGGDFTDENGNIHDFI